MQSVAVKLLVEREREIRAFLPEESWKITANIDFSQKFAIELVKIDEKKVTIKNFDEVKKILAKRNISENLEMQQDKKGNMCFLQKHEEKFILQKSEKKSSKRLP